MRSFDVYQRVAGCDCGQGLQCLWLHSYFCLVVVLYGTVGAFICVHTHKNTHTGTRGPDCTVKIMHSALLEKELLPKWQVKEQVEDGR